MTTVDLRSLARAEAERLARARRLIAEPPNGSRSLHVAADRRVRPEADTSVGPYIDSRETGPYRLASEPAEPDDTWIAIARSTPLRIALQGRRLQVWQLGLEDATGRGTESTLVAVSIDDSFSPAVADVAGVVERSAAAWRDEALRTLGQFGAVRLARERAIAAAQDPAIDALQPGLFDRRAERLRAQHEATRSSSRDDQRSRLDALVRATTLRPQPARLMLVLVPHR